MARSKVTDKVAEDSSHSVSVVDQNPKLAEGEEDISQGYFSGRRGPFEIDGSLETKDDFALWFFAVY